MDIIILLLFLILLCVLPKDLQAALWGLLQHVGLALAAVWLYHWLASFDDLIMTILWAGWFVLVVVLISWGLFAVAGAVLAKKKPEQNN